MKKWKLMNWWIDEKKTWWTSGCVKKLMKKSWHFEKVDNNIFVAGCYNGSGIGVGTLFGEQIALKANNQNTDEIKIMLHSPLKAGLFLPMEQNENENKTTLLMPIKHND